MTTVSMEPDPQNPTNNDYVARAMKHTQPKEMDEKQRDCHIAIRNLFREFVTETGAASINKATTEQLKSAIEQTMVYVKNGTAYEGKKFPVNEQIIVAAWALRFEANVVAKAEEITVGRAIEKYIIADFDFEANSGKKKSAAPKAAKSKGVAPVAAKAQPLAAVFGEWAERLDLNEQLIFHGAEPVSLVADLLEAWNQGGEFRLMVKRSTAMAVKVETLDEQADRQTLVAFDVNGKKVGMAYMDKLTQYFTVVEKNA